jgi:serine/threonine protein phosphatase PrpC
VGLPEDAGPPEHGHPSPYAAHSDFVEGGSDEDGDPVVIQEQRSAGQGSPGHGSGEQGSAQHGSPDEVAEHDPVEHKRAGQAVGDADPSAGGRHRVLLNVEWVPDQDDDSTGQPAVSGESRRSLVRFHGRRAAKTPDPVWPKHTDGRWVVGDAGNQPRTVPRPTRRPAGAPVDTVLDGAVVGNLVYRAASLRGFSHQETGKPRQDAFAVRVSRSENWLVTCVADGVSDGPRSEIAAEIASDAVARSLVVALDDSALPSGPVEWESLVRTLPWQKARDAANHELVQRARHDVEKIYRAREIQARGIHSQEVQVPPEALPQSHADVRALMATTAVSLVLATAPDPDGRYWYSVGVIAGDSASYLLHCDRWRQVVVPKDVSGEVASNSVRALPTEAVPTLWLGSLAAGDAVALFSDGVSDPLGSGQGNVGRFLAEHWRTPPDLFDFGKHVGFYSKGWFDDRTAVVAWAPEVGP